MFAIILFVLPTLVVSITVSPNGNSPEIKMVGGMMVDVQKGVYSMKIDTKYEDNENIRSTILPPNITKLGINERYRRLIPYMTFYYANDAPTQSTTEANYNQKNIEIAKAEIVETNVEQPKQRQSKNVVYSNYRNIPRYQGNRLTQYNIASANPTKAYKEFIPTFENIPKAYPLDSEYNVHPNREFGRYDQKQYVKSPSAPYSTTTRKPYLNLYDNEDFSDVNYYTSEKNFVPKYRLVPYEQNIPFPSVSPNPNFYDKPKKIPVPVLISKDQIYIVPRPTRPQYYYDNSQFQQPTGRKPSTIVSKNYFSKPNSQPELSQPVIESGFKPIINPALSTTETSVYTSTIPKNHIPTNEGRTHLVQIIEKEPVTPNYVPYAIQQTTHPSSQYVPMSEINTDNQLESLGEYVNKLIVDGKSNKLSIGDLLNSLQQSNAIPKPITKENVGSSIRTLLQVLNALQGTSQQNEAEAPILSTPKPFEVAQDLEPTTKPLITTPDPDTENPEFHQEPYLAPVYVPSQYLDDGQTEGGSSQRFPLPVTSDAEGGTPGRPGVDYPVLTSIPHTSFNCKTQRYKGFFADTETKCQVWHYCDLNGGQASFLCPNGTIFSQAALTCDWWFNVRCASTTQLYVLNESLYKYILPHSPKFPEDYSGPLVDKYLSLKFKEMEEQFRKNKNKQSSSDKIYNEENEEVTTETSTEIILENTTEDVDVNKAVTVDESSVLVESPGASGNLERLHI